MVVSGRHEGAYARVLGGAMSHDGYHPTHLNPDHREIRRCYQQALSNAKVFPSEIAYLNAHGPGTAQCDAAEAEMLDTLLTDAEVFSVKPLVGHCQGAAVLGRAGRDLPGLRERDHPGAEAGRAGPPPPARRARRCAGTGSR